MPKHQGVLSSGELAASASISGAGKPALCYGYILRGGTAQSSISLRNGGSGGTILWKDSIAAQGAAGDAVQTVMFKTPVVFTTDLYATLAGTAAAATVLYIPL